MPKRGVSGGESVSSTMYGSASSHFLFPAKRGLASRYAAKSSFLAFFLRSSRLANAEAIVARASVSQ